MASKDTPKKLYKKRTESTVTTRCRLCNRVVDPSHSKNIYRAQNQTILRSAEIVYGGKLPQDSNLPHLICAPCERRLNNFIQFKKTITDTQRGIQENLRTKRCVELSPSISKPTTKVRATATTIRRSINFGVALDENEPTQSAAVNPVSIKHHVMLLFYFISKRQSLPGT
jgi:hypothetical protein